MEKMAGSPWFKILVTAAILLPLLICSGRICYVKPTLDTPCPADPCFTLSEYAQQPDLYLTSNTTLLLLPGDHFLSVNFTVENIIGFKIRAQLSSSIENHTIQIVCQELVGFTFRNVSCMTMYGLIFNSCGKSATGNSLFSKYASYPTAYGVMIYSGLGTEIIDCSFNNSIGTALGVFYSSLVLRGSNSFTNNCKKCSEKSFCFGGGIHTNSCTLIFSGNSTFKNNSAKYGGGIFAWNSTINHTGVSAFRYNAVDLNGGGILAAKTSLNLRGDISFINNLAIQSGGGLELLNSTVIFTGNSTFKNNFGKREGGCISAAYSTLNFDGNTALINGSTTFENGNGGGVNAHYSTLNFNGSTTFGNNTATGGYGGVFYAWYSILNLVGNNTFVGNSARSGGGINTKGSTLKITANMFGEYSGSCDFSTLLFMDNSAHIHGGAVYTEDSTLTFQGCNNFVGNSAQYFGGAVYSDNSSMVFSGNTIFSLNSGRSQGGGMYGLGTSAYFSGNTSFTANSAARGGGEYLADSFNFFSRYAVLIMDSNDATEYGGAVYVEDSDPTSYCFPDIESLGKCFFQIHGIFKPSDQFASLDWENQTAVVRAYFDIYLKFYSNHANIAGSAVYGGSVDGCVMEVYYTLGREIFSNAHQLYLELEPNSISSDPFAVGLCRDGTLAKNTSKLSTQIYPGELLHFPVLAAGQGDDVVPRPAIIQAVFTNTRGDLSLGQFQNIQHVTQNCTELYYQVYSSTTNNSGTLVLYADGPCLTDGLVIKISLNVLPCPAGFSLNSSQKICDCEPRLQQYSIRCNITHKTLTREGNFWVGYDNHSQGLILHPHCPFDYCKPATDHISFSLNNTNLQCENTRSGILCGECKVGLSLALGSSKCLQCSNIHVLLLLPFALAGVALVLLLLTCRLTVADGTINGLIFYGNIVAVNRAIFFPPNQTNILTVFIAWVNLDLGIETCFFDGMDEYAKTWLQFAFPLYVWCLMGVIIIMSRYSIMITGLLGSNPVPALATLFLLSYAKLLRTIISALFFTFLNYPGDVQVAVWLRDGNIQYLHGKHIGLFLVASLTLLILFLPYTFLITVGHRLQAESIEKFFHWINKIKPFLDAYQAPYRDKLRYWTGLLLCLRCALFLVFAFNIQADPSLNLLAISSVAFGLTLLTRFTGTVYKKLHIDILEASFILNLGILAVATYYVKLAVVPASQPAATYTSVGVAFATFIGILLYHTYQYVWPQLKQRFKQLREGPTDPESQPLINPSRPHGIPSQLPITPTTTVVECPSPRLRPVKHFNELREPLLDSDSGSNKA